MWTGLARKRLWWTNSGNQNQLDLIFRSLFKSIMEYFLSKCKFVLGSNRPLIASQFWSYNLYFFFLCFTSEWIKFCSILRIIKKQKNVKTGLNCCPLGFFIHGLLKDCVCCWGVFLVVLSFVFGFRIFGASSRFQNSAYICWAIKGFKAKKDCSFLTCIVLESLLSHISVALEFTSVQFGS